MAETPNETKNYETYYIIRNLIQCDAAPIGTGMLPLVFDKNDKCPYCRKPISEHRKL